MSVISVVVGIDVAKAHVDVSVLGAKLDAQRFDNQAEAHSALAAAFEAAGCCLGGDGCHRWLRGGAGLCAAGGGPACGGGQPTPGARLRQVHGAIGQDRPHRRA